MNSLQHVLRFIGFPVNPPGSVATGARRRARTLGDGALAAGGSASALRARIAALVQKNRQLEATGEAKTRLFAAAIHDLRQPLQTLVLFSDALCDGEADAGRLQRIAQIRQSVDSLDRLFTGLLDLTQLDAGRMLPDCRDLALDPLLQELQHNFQAVAQAQGLRLVVRPTQARAQGDALMLTRILNNLVCNALRHTRSGGVLVGTRPDRHGVRIDVCDTGIGIAAQHQTRVFDEFYRVHAPGRAACGDGMGLGLATVQRLAELQGASVRLRSRPGRGTVVSVLLPAARAAIG